MKKSNQHDFECGFKACRNALSCESECDVDAVDALKKSFRFEGKKMTMVKWPSSF